MGQHIALPPPQTTVSFPDFVGIALSVLPKFLKAINAELACVGEIRFSPDGWQGLKDPPAAEVTFELKGNSSVTFHFKPRAVNEGPLAGYLHIYRIVNRVGYGGTHEELVQEFRYLKHHCGCPQCHGTEYPFLPEGIDQVWFEKSCNENRRLLTIREFVGRLDC